MALTPAQQTALAAALRAETDPSVAAAVSARNDVFLHEWVNGASEQDAWKASTSGAELFEAMNINQFDGIAQSGKREAWRMMLDFAQSVDFRKQKYRNGVVDIWSSGTQAQNILTAMLEKATRGELYLTPAIPGNISTTDTIAGLNRSFVGSIGLTELSVALNNNP